MSDKKVLQKTNMTQQEFKNSVHALLQHRPAPKVKVGIALKAENLEYGAQVDFFAALNEVAAEYGVTMTTTVQGVWDDSEDNGQLELFPPQQDAIAVELDKILGDDLPPLVDQDTGEYLDGV